MSDLFIRMYHRGINKGLPNGIIEHFNKDFREFEAVYRTKCKPARQLADI